MTLMKNFILSACVKLDWFSNDRIDIRIWDKLFEITEILILEKDYHMYWTDLSLWSLYWTRSTVYQLYTGLQIAILEKFKLI
jgi:hypothetical protein